jgi:cell division septal protein FtsQ
VKKQKRVKKVKFPAFLAEMKESAVRKVLNAAVIGLFLAMAFFLAKAFIQRSDYFGLEFVDIKGMSDGPSAVSIGTELARSYKGRNIFGIDIRSIGRQLQTRYPDAKNVFVMRTLPDRLTVLFDFRKPVAILADGRSYPVDAEGFIVLNADEKSLEGLTVISGVGVRYDERSSRKVESKNLKSALELLAAIRNARFMAKYPVTRIEAGDAKAMAFYLEDGLEVRIGNENFKERLGMLHRTLRDPRLVRERIKYLDLRFGEDAVIGPK